jgi:hypothetical protein
MAVLLTLAGGAYFFVSAGGRAFWSFLFGALVSTALLSLLARTLYLLDVTGESGGNAPKSTNALLAISQFAILGAVYVAVDRFPLHTNATAAGFGVAVLAATLQQAVSLLRGRG